MIVEYKKSYIGDGFDLIISSDAFKAANSEAGWDDHNAMMFAIKTYCEHYEHSDVREFIGGRDIEEAARHIKGKGSIVITAKQGYGTTWCEIYAISDGSIIPVKTRNNDGDFVINYSAKTKREFNKRGGGSELKG